MFKTNALAHALYALIVLASVSCFAMQREEPKNYIIKTLNVTVNTHDLEPLKVPLKMKVATPDYASTQEEKNAYYLAHKNGYLNKLKTVLVAYEDQLKKSEVGNFFSTILPSELIFAPDENRLSIRHRWQTEHVSDSVKGSLQTRMECTFEKGQLTAQAPLLDITYEDSQVTESLTLNSLFEMFPIKIYLNFNPHNIQENHQKIMHMAFQRAIGLQQGKNPAELPDPRRYEDELHLADLKKMVSHYLSTKKQTK